MRFDTGTIIAIAAVLLFYLRLILLQRQRGKTISTSSPSRPGKHKRQAAAAPGNWIVIANPYLVGLGVLLIIAGVAVTLITTLPGAARQIWWLFVSLGVLLMGLGIR